MKYWMPKLERNKARDIEHLANLESQGWEVLTIWQCEVEAKDGERLISKLRNFLENPSK
jgi:DNA mismatch endonuclease (patch repair protein)